MNNEIEKYFTKSKEAVFYLVALLVPLILLVSAEVAIRIIGGEKLEIQPVPYGIYTPKYYDWFADPVVVPPKGENEYRVILLGGSTAAGFPREQFEQKLNEYAKKYKVNRRFSFFNLAWPAHHSTQEFIRLYQHALDEKPDMIITLHGTNDLSVVLYNDNDPGEPAYFDSFKEILQYWGLTSQVEFKYVCHNTLLRYSYLYRMLSVTVSRVTNSNASGLAMRANPMYHYRRVNPYDETLREKIVDLYSKNIDAMVALTKQFNIKFLVTLQPMLMEKLTKSDEEEQKVTTAQHDFQKHKDDNDKLIKMTADWNLMHTDEFKRVFNRFSKVLAHYKRNNPHDAFYYEDFSYLFRDTKDTIFSDSCHFAPNFTKDGIAKGYAPIMAIYLRYVMSDADAKKIGEIPLDIFDEWTREVVNEYDNLPKDL